MTGEALKRKLSPMGKSAAQWAELLGVSERTMYRTFRAPDVRTAMVERLCAVLGKPITFLYDGGGDAIASHDGTGMDDGQGGPSGESLPAGSALDLDGKVNELLSERHRKMGDLAHHMGVNYTTAMRMCSNNSCTLASLMKIADFFKVPVTHFLPTDSLALEEAEKDRQIHFLKGQIEVYRRTIASLLADGRP